MIVARMSETRIDPCLIDRAIRVLHRSVARQSSKAASAITSRPPRQWRAVVTTVLLLTVTASIARAEPARRPAVVHAKAAELDAYVAEAARRFALPAAWIWTVMRIESAGRPQAVSPKGARGLMQIMPGTWAELQSRFHLGADPFDAHDNITAGAAYLRELHDRYGAPGFLAAYNAGAGRYEDHLATGRSLPIETVGYVSAAVRLLDGGDISEGRLTATRTRLWTEAALFPVSGSAPQTPQPGPGSPPVPAPVRRSTALLPTLAPHSDGLFATAAIRRVGP